MADQVNYHVLMPFGRYSDDAKLPVWQCELLRLQVEHLKDAGVQLHVIHSFDLPKFDLPWVHYFRVEEDPKWDKTGAACYLKANQWLDNHTVPPEDYVCMRSDDDGQEPGFWEKLRKHTGDVVINGAFVHRLLQQIARPESMLTGLCGMTQFNVKAKLLGGRRFINENFADGLFVEDLARDFAPLDYAPECHSVWNMFKPGFWPEGRWK